MNNAKVAAEIAVELAKIENPIDEEYNKEHSNEPIRNATNQSKKRPVSNLIIFLIYLHLLKILKRFELIFAKNKN